MKISLITCTFNSGNTLRDTIESVLMQTYQDYEYLLIDGASTDTTLEIIYEFEQKFQGRMRWISEKDSGIYDAMNKGIRMATGDIVGFLNSDDFFVSENILSVINNEFSEENVQAIYGNVGYVRPDNLEKIIRMYDSSHWKKAMFRWGIMPAHPSFYTYRDNYTRLGYYKIDYKIAADYELLIRFLYKNDIPAHFIPIEFVRMRVGGVSTSGLSSLILLNKEIVRACKENGIWTSFPMLMFKYFIKIKELILR